MLSGTCVCDVAHIFPFSMLKGWDGLDGYWAMLSMFWGPEKSDAWKKAVLGDGQEPADLCQNLLCLSPTLRVLGLFAFKPLDLSPDQKVLWMELNHRSDKATRVDLLTDPPPPTNHTTATHSSYRLSI